jgi:pimeloyl-ACP methyl ester carboxylesterase
MSRSEVRYARSGEINIAYQVTGDGPFDLVLVPGFISHLELDWAEPRHARFLDRLGAFARLIRFDKRGTGLSDRPSVLGGIETRMDDVRAVMDAVGCARAALVAYWEGGPMAALFAATYPERTSALALYGTFARRTRFADYPWHPTREEMIRGADRIVEDWGTERTTALDAFSPGADAALWRWWIERERAGASPGAIGQLIRSNLDIDVRPALRSIQAATLVLQPESNSAEGEYIASLIPGARFATTPGESGLPWLAPEVADEIEEFLTGVRPTPVKDRVLATSSSPTSSARRNVRAYSEIVPGANCSTAITPRCAVNSNGSEARRSIPPVTASWLCSTAPPALSTVHSKSAPACASWVSTYALASIRARSNACRRRSLAASRSTSGHASQLAREQARCSLPRPRTTSSPAPTSSSRTGAPRSSRGFRSPGNSFASRADECFAGATVLPFETNHSRRAYVWGPRITRPARFLLANPS